ncbi:MAG: AMP-binding protein [Pseudomonadota bacterium]
MSATKPLWSPSKTRVEKSQMSAFAKFVSHRIDKHFNTYEELHEWSCADGAVFWDLIWEFCGLKGEKGERIVEHEERMPGAKYFPDARLNYAENLLRLDGASEAIVFRCEEKSERRMSWQELHALVSRFQQAFKAKGLKKGDRVSAMMPNMPETIAAMLAVTSLGAVWSSCSPDFGEKGVLDRFSQVKPKFFIACDGYWYAGKRLDISAKLAGIVPALGSELNIIVPLLGVADETAERLDNTVSMRELLDSIEPGGVWMKYRDMKASLPSEVELRKCSMD